MILTAALILDAILGEPKWLWTRVPHPAVLLGKLVAGLEHRLNNRTRAAGLLALGILVLVSGGIGWLLSLLPVVLHIIIVAILLAQRSLVTHVLDVADGLAVDLHAGRRAVSMIVGRSTDTLDEPAIARAAIESGAENLSDGVIAPALWFLVAGLPGLLIYKAVNTADSMIGHRSEQYGNFGWAAARFDDLLNLVPARLTGALIAAASGTKAAWRVMRRDAGKHRSPNAGWPESAMAGALDVRLSGPRQYSEGPSADPWLNATGRDPGRTDISGAAGLMWRAWAIFVIATGVLWML